MTRPKLAWIVDVIKKTALWNVAHAKKNALYHQVKDINATGMKPNQNV